MPWACPHMMRLKGFYENTFTGVAEIVSLSCPSFKRARLAQLDRALPSEGRGRRFESSIAHHLSIKEERISGSCQFVVGKPKTRILIEHKKKQPRAAFLGDSMRSQNPPAYRA